MYMYAAYKQAYKLKIPGNVSSPTQSFQASLGLLAYYLT